MARSDYRELVTRLVRDQSGLIAESDTETVLDLAVIRYNADRGTGCVLSEDEDTVPLRHRHGVASWAASILFDQLAGYHTGTSQPTLQADSVDYQSKGREYSARAKQARGVYFEALGITPGKPAPASAVVAFNLSDRPRRLLPGGMVR